ncbi:hypothetical protein RRF57_003317 [Xylaria bambusicola]|uniref:Protein kinase domain-containing protein n=1 Tax=Xylaria bambusicola TaxID=326684 RepID=A0AAN7Z2N5_9PEZI
MPFARLHQTFFFRSHKRPFSVTTSRDQWLSKLGLGGGWGARKPLQPRVFPTSGFKLIDASKTLEEEWFNDGVKCFYPVRLGEVFQNRYQVVAKIGCGACSTTWLGHDLQSLGRDHTYVSLKVHRNDLQHSRELEIYEHIKKHTAHLSSYHIRPVHEFFRIEGQYRDHDVMVQTPLTIAVSHLQRFILSGNVFTPHLAKAVVQRVLRSLDFLHSDAHVIHSGKFHCSREARYIHSENLLMGCKNRDDRDRYFAQVEEAELNNPVPRKVMKDKTIYVTQVLNGPIDEVYLCDFGQARIGGEGSGDPGPVFQRAPEVILDMKWSYSIDLWNVGLLAWEMLHGERLFEQYDRKYTWLNDAHHLANMIALLGPPPLDFLNRNKTYLQFWREGGDWRGIVPIPRKRTFESLDLSLMGEEKARFLDFLRALLCWAPEKRLTAKQALSHPWLTAPTDNP